MRTILLQTILIILIIRVEAATYTVSSLADAGAGTLRDAITLANGNAGADIINFSVAGTITLASDLPTPTGPVTIDAFTAPGYVANAPVVQLDGFTWGILFNDAAAVGSIVRGLIIWGATNGIEINGVNGIIIEGCWIGINGAGAIPANRIGFTGIYLVNSDNCVIGGTTNGTRNVLSGCDFEGVFLSAGSDNNQVIGNYIGTGTGGNTDVGNNERGVRIENSNNNVIGGINNTYRNIISGNNNHGIFVQSSTGTTIASNFIGIGADGTTAVGNGIHGIILNACTNSIIGGTLTTGNRIGSNGGSGVSLENVSNTNTLIGNYIGTENTGAIARPNAVHGVNINNSTDCVVQGNLISGNTLSGINVTLASHRTIIRSNIIGLSLANAAMGNLQHGVYIEGSDNCVIGGTGYTDRNFISSNGNTGGENGLSILSCNGHTIKNNFCGLDLTGKLARGNFDSGMSLTNSTGNTIGGATLAERNVCAANNNFGMFGSNLDNSTIRGNYFGTDSTGNIALGNRIHGVQVQDGCNLLVWQSNVASGNGVGAGNGIGLNLLSITNNTIYGNHVGIGLDGITDVGNLIMGIRLGATSTNNTIGGTGAGQRNIVSGNGDHGIFLDGYSSSNVIRNNYVGSDITGLIAVPNAGSGIFMLDVSNTNTIGGAGANEGNLTCCSTGGNGIVMQISDANTVYGNLIGVNALGAISPGFGNNQNGILIGSYWNLSNQANSNILGGLGAGQANTITQNGLDGVQIAVWGGSNGSNYNPIIGNKIYCNGGLGINHESNEATENQGVPAPVITFRDANTITGTGVAGNTIHVYRNSYSDGSGACDCEGEIYVGTTTVTGGGTWSLTHSLGLTVAQYNAVTATQTNATNSTSEFASCTVPLPVTLVNFDGHLNDHNNAVLSWSTIMEREFSHFVVLRSEDGSMFTELDILPAQGPGTLYSYTDEHFSGQAYYKLAMVDKDGKVKHSAAIYLGSTQVLQVFPNPVNGEVRISGWNSGLQAKLLNSVGVTVIENLAAEFSVAQLPPGVYVVQVSGNNTAQNLKLIVE